LLKAQASFRRFRGWGRRRLLNKLESAVGSPKHWLEKFLKAIGLPLGMGNLKKIGALYPAFSNSRQ